MRNTRPSGEARLWAPWRTGYLLRPQPRGCVFCAAKRSRADRRHHVVARGRHAFVLLNRYPYNNGHVMVAPNRHVGRFEALTPAEWQELFVLGRRMLRRLRQTVHPQGFNLGMNLGRTGGAGIPGHVHLHLVPRWQGDTNFMPIVGETKVISQALDEMFSLLAEAR